MIEPVRYTISLSFLLFLSLPMRLNSMLKKRIFFFFLDVVLLKLFLGNSFINNNILGKGSPTIKISNIYLQDRQINHNSSPHSF